MEELTREQEEQETGDSFYLHEEYIKLDFEFWVAFGIEEGSWMAVSRHPRDVGLAFGKTKRGAINKLVRKYLKYLESVKKSGEGNK
jgi:hypothetical protein